MTPTNDKVDQSGSDGRAKFEAWYAEKYQGDASTFTRFDFGIMEYRCAYIQQSWLAWSARSALQAQPSAPANANAMGVDDLAQLIRTIDGNHSMGAGALAEALHPHLYATPADMPASDTANELATWPDVHHHLALAMCGFAKNESPTYKNALAALNMISEFGLLRAIRYATAPQQAVAASSEPVEITRESILSLQAVAHFFEQLKEGTVAKAHDFNSYRNMTIRDAQSYAECLAKDFNTARANIIDAFDSVPSTNQPVQK